MVVCVLCKDEVPVRFWLGPHVPMHIGKGGVRFSPGPQFVVRPDVHRESASPISKKLEG